MGVIQLSRAIGDRKIAKYITAEPEISEYTLNEDDQFVVLASDGLWDVLSPQKTVDILGNTVKHADYGAKSIVADALQLGSDDNITSIVVYLSKPGTEGDQLITLVSESNGRPIGIGDGLTSSFDPYADSR
eukprot:CAMPEP_0170192986 /NCGR_PEP_ID=MMETSP0040_2-20121228/55752_1 /TAXON_ID=641309 /ORGANISM="Lotharella oceanica, Strain CCMP622" /LENGTH=130 /DNA_ID=CAMNT_0010441489 /DNA_START=11 /DNA_END=403 /DNA_ORIENTATION=-